VRISLAGSAETFECRQGETMLRAALKAGYAVPYECASGTCGNCKARLIEGTVDTRWRGATGLSDRDRKKGDRILCCQSIPITDCVIQLRAERDNREPAPERHAAKISAIVELCSGMRRLIVTPDRAIPFLPGQFVLFDMGSEIGFRAYSMANPPDSAERMEFLVKAKSGGAGTEFLFERLKLGDRLKLEGPYGRGYLRTDGVRPIVAVAGGSGLAPMLSIVRSGLSLGARRKVQLFFGVNRVEELFCWPELLDLKKEYSDFELTIALRDGTIQVPDGLLRIGRVGDVMLASCPDLTDCDLYFAGPPVMVDSLIAQTIGQNRIPADRVFFDRF
jgi:NAD(P)H-flavin reductase/ferredoxin